MCQIQRRKAQATLARREAVDESRQVDASSVVYAGVREECSAVRADLGTVGAALADAELLLRQGNGDAPWPGDAQ